MPTLNGSNPTPLRPVAQVGRMKLWLRQEVDDYVASDLAQVARRRRQRVRPGLGEGKKRSEFVTLSGFAAEVGMSLAQAQQVFNEPSFPAAAAWFGEADVWLRRDIEQHRLGNPAPAAPANAPKGLLMSGDEICHYLAYSISTQRSGEMDVPSPVAVNLYLRSDVEAHLDADPRRRELLAARRARRRRDVEERVLAVVGRRVCVWGEARRRMGGRRSHWRLLQNPAPALRRPLP